jgi:hypothetical protein
VTPLTFRPVPQPGEGDAIVRWAAGFANGGAGGVFVTYEQIHPHDAFGQVKSQNLMILPFFLTARERSLMIQISTTTVTQLPHALQVMMRNLVTRGCPLYSLPAYPDLPAQKMRCVPRRTRHCCLASCDVQCVCSF